MAKRTHRAHNVDASSTIIRWGMMTFIFTPMRKPGDMWLCCFNFRHSHKDTFLFEQIKVSYFSNSSVTSWQKNTHREEKAVVWSQTRRSGFILVVLALVFTMRTVCTKLLLKSAIPSLFTGHMSGCTTWWASFYTPSPIYNSKRFDWTNVSQKLWFEMLE